MSDLDAIRQRDAALAWHVHNGRLMVQRMTADAQDPYPEELDRHDLLALIAALTAERDAALRTNAELVRQVATLRETLDSGQLIQFEAIPHRAIPEGDVRAVLTDTSAAAEAHDERVRSTAYEVGVAEGYADGEKAERKRIAEAVRGLPSFDDAVDRPAVLAIVEAPDA